MSEERWDDKKKPNTPNTYSETMSGIQPLLARTWDRARVIPPPFPARKGGKGSGGFASLFDFNPDGRYKNPVMVTCTDGVGSKLKIARLTGNFATVGIDLVAMSVNDLICVGAEPLVFLDYLAMPSDNSELTTQLVRGISAGCSLAGCSLMGGETAILPDFYAPDDFDMAGFCTGIVERDKVIDGRSIKAGDVMIGLESSGIHSNGYTLVRRIVFDANKLRVGDQVPELGGTVGAALLEPTKIYVKTIHAILADNIVSGLANITGGGLIDNVARILPPGLRAMIRRGSWPVPPIFDWLQRLGNVAQREMDRVFNNGIGFVILAPASSADGIVQKLKQDGTKAWVIGEVREGETGVEIG